MLNVPVSVGADAIIPDSGAMIESADGCSGSAADHRAWMRTLTGSPIAYSLENGSLVLTNDIGRTVFKGTRTYLSRILVNRLRSRSSHPAASGMARDQPA